MKTALSVFLILILIVSGYLFYTRHEANTPVDTSPVTTAASSTDNTDNNVAHTPATTTNATSSLGTVSTADIKITSPKSGQTVSSPLTLTGQARGTWFFEASAPVYLADANGKKIAQGTIKAEGDWMTTNLVPFSGTLTWTASSSATSTKGALVFMNDNPSGNPSLQKTVTVPVIISR
jgi:hypothetical protein